MDQYRLYHPKAEDVEDEESTLLHALFVSSLIDSTDDMQGGSLAIYRGSGLHLERIRQHIAPHMSGGSFKSFFKSPMVKNFIGSTIKTAGQNFLGAVTSGQGDIKTRVLDGLKAAAHGSVKQAKGLIQQQIQSNAQSILQSLA